MPQIIDQMRRPLGGALLALALAAAPAAARPITLDDILHMQAVGAVEADPTGRWLVFERRVGPAESFRFDYDGHDELVRTRLWRVDLQRPGKARPLFPASRRAGYALGPFSPDGRRVVVFRLTDRNWELGVATPATGHVRWLGLTPEQEDPADTVAWASANELLVIARRFGDMPFQLRYTRVAQLELPDRRRATAAGKRSVTVVGSGRYLDVRPQDPPRRLLRLDVASGRRTVLATGAFMGLMPSPDGRRVALLEYGGDVVMDAAHPIQGDYGYESLHRRLALLDLGTGRLTRPCTGWDVLSRPLRWSPDGAELLAFARRDADPWSLGRVFRIAAATGLARAVGEEIAPTLESRPDVVRAAWFAGDPIVWGRHRGAENLPSHWYRLAPGGPVSLGPDLHAESSDALSVTGDGVLLAAGGDIWRIAPDGRAVRAAAGVRPLNFAQVIHASMYDYDAGTGDHLLGVRSDPSGETLVKVTKAGVQTLGRLPAGAEILSEPGSRGALVRSFPAGAEQRLTWVGEGRPPTPVATFNRALADVAGPEVRTVRHAGPHGEALTSWLLLPPARAGRPPPLIVRPYLGSAASHGREKADPRHEWMDDRAVLLVAHGYAVLLPSLPRPGNGPGVTAGIADRVLGIVDTAAADPELGRRFDVNRLGLWGESFGGYSTLAIVTQTNRFRAAVAQESMSDLFSMWGQFIVADRVDPRHGLSPFYSAGWVENVQPWTNAPPFADPQRYLFDSPALHADKVTTPILMFHGELDSFPTGQPEEMFSALLRQNKDAVLAIYWGENHMTRSPGNLRDIFERSFRWLDEHLDFNATPATGRLADSPAPALANGGQTPPPRPPTG